MSINEVQWMLINVCKEARSRNKHYNAELNVAFPQFWSSFGCRVFTLLEIYPAKSIQTFYKIPNFLLLHVMSLKSQFNEDKLLNNGDCNCEICR